MNQEILYQTSYLGLYIKVYPDRVDFRSGKGPQSILLSQVISVQPAIFGVMQVTIITSDGQSHNIPTSKKKEVVQAIMQAKSLASDNPQQQPMQPSIVVPRGTPIDAEIQRVKLEIEQRRLQLGQVNANMSNVRSHYQQKHVHGGGKLGHFVRDVQRDTKDAKLKKQQPVKEKLQREKLALEQQLNQLKLLKAQGITHITK